MRCSINYNKSLPALLGIGYLSLAVLLLIVILSFYIANWVAILQCPFALSFEGHVLWASWKLAMGANIYSPSSIINPPWTVMIYPPLYMVAGALLVKCFGVAYAWLRLVTIVSALFLVGALFVLFRKSGATLASSLTGIVLFMSFTPTLIFSCLARCDILALCLSAWGLERFVARFQSTSQDKDKMLSYWAALCLMVLACLTRQQSVVAPLAVVTFLLWSGQPRLAIKFLIWTAGSITVICLLINALTGGFLSHIFVLKEVTWQWQLLSINFAYLGHDAIKCVIGLAILVIGLIYKHRITGITRLPYALLIISCVLMLYSQGLPGASSNHLLFTYLAFSWLIAICLSVLPWLSILMLASCLIGLNDVASFLPRQAHTLLTAHSVASQFPSQTGPVLSEDPYWAIKNNCPLELVDPLTLMHVWSQKPEVIQSLIQALADKRYKALLINSYDVTQGGGNVWTPEIMDTIHANYKSVGQMPGNGEMQYLYLPRTQRSQGHHGQ
ncbi:MAG: hypothetical protein HY711_07630 [Candidatus Melainabacteria bacterium]|nr:hypothetical protein [Candidatus Melainabacteria bacterium]